MKKLPDKYFDLIVTDPPYGINIASNGYVGGRKLAEVTNYGIQEWDKSIPSGAYFREMFRVAKNLIIFGGNYMTDYLPPSSCWVVWDKDNTGNFADCELAWTSFQKSVKRLKFRWNGMLQEQMNWKEKRVHPTQKPIALGRWLLETFANKGDKIFDPFAGSGSFLVACKQLGYDFVGCEINKDYVDIIDKRLRQKTVSDFYSNESSNRNLTENSDEFSQIEATPQLR